MDYMNHMFEDASSFNQPLDNWEVSNVMEMRGMFENAESFNQPLNNWHILIFPIRAAWMARAYFSGALQASVSHLEKLRKRQTPSTRAPRTDNQR